MVQNLFIGVGLALIVAAVLMKRKRAGKPLPWLYALFFVSGFPALIYQLVWQRSLFAIYGVNIESVTVVITAFMLGLGLGSLFGGWLSKKSGIPRLLVFGAVELGIAAFGAASLQIFHWVALYTAGTSVLKAGLLSFILVLIPTVLMGSTLPLLVAHIVERSGNVGRSVGTLYFVNTLGSAAACFAAGLILMRTLGQAGSVHMAAAINACVGLSVLLLHVRPQKKHRESLNPRPLAEHTTATVPMDEYLPFSIGMVVAALSGFVALGYEILWYRVLSFLTGGVARALALLLGTYLAGIALGAFASERLCRMQRRTGLRRFVLATGVFVVGANILGYLVVPFMAYKVQQYTVHDAFLLIAAATACLGATFPLLCHISIASDSDSGAKLSFLYMSNIIGSATGSFIIGFILMDIWPLSRIAVVLALLGIGLGLLVVIQCGNIDAKEVTAALMVCLLVVMAIVGSSGRLFANVYEKLQYKGGWTRVPRFSHVVETKSGVITVSADGKIFGGGIYDGVFNTDLIHDSNLIIRPFALSAFHPAPRQVLMIGLSSGSWAQVIANHPQVERLTIVEINPGYLRLIPQYPEVASLLKNPKVEIVIDDGRRWLLRNPDKKFDAIVMNTTYHWRDHTSNLLSIEFLQLIRKHLNPGGIHFYNTTFSIETLLTGVNVFPYSLRVVNFLAVSDSPIELNKQRWREVLLKYQIDGKPVFNLSIAEHRERLEEVLSLVDTASVVDPPGFAMEFGKSVQARYHGIRITTDDNMGTEWFQ